MGSGSASVHGTGRERSVDRALHLVPFDATSLESAALPSVGSLAATPIHQRAPMVVPVVPVALATLSPAHPQRTGHRRLVKAAMDRVLAAVGLLLLAPVLVLIALVVRCTSRGPALFVQTRIGRDGRPFRMVKFRSMYVDAEGRLEALLALNENDGHRFKMRRDPRVTPVGRVLRRFSLDELPQLINVLTGSMSLVGPRPPLPQEVARYDERTCRRLVVKPGLTGLWQVSGRSDLGWDESLSLDLHYVDHWSLALDLVVLLRTARAVVRATGAY